MKKLNLLLIALITITSLFLSGCSEDLWSDMIHVSLTTDNPQQITENSAFCTGKMESLTSFTEAGFCWSTEENPTVDEMRIAADIDSTSNMFSAKISSLLPNQKYYIRSYSISVKGETYGPQKSFTTLPGYSKEISAPFDLTETSARFKVTIVNYGGKQMYERGVCWSLSPQPTPSENSMKDPSATEGTFEVNITGLAKNNIYHARAYVIAANDTTYSDEVSFVPATPVAEMPAGMANCYLLSPSTTTTNTVLGEKLEIPVAIANVAFPGTINEGDELLPMLVWSDSPYGCARTVTKTKQSAYCIDSMYVSGKGPDAKLVIHKGKTAGNSVVAVTNKNGQILWSWHIWITAADPTVNTKTLPGGKSIMECNIGATTISTGATQPGYSTTSNGFGMYYQWGRKDPFPGHSGVTTTTSGSPVPSVTYTATTPTKYTFTIIKNKLETADSIISTSISYSTTSAVAVRAVIPATNYSTNNLGNAIQNPITFYYQGQHSSTADWNVTHAVQAVNNNLWRTASGKKSVFDPSPEGWMVPSNEDIAGLTTSSTFNWDVTYKGRSYQDVNGQLTWFPAGGSWFYGSGLVTGLINSLGEFKSGNYWTASPGNGSFATALTFDRYSSSISHNIPRANGYFIRCVKE